MIINTGMRTDIPAFYSTWLLNRIKEGYVLVRNPYYRQQVTRYSLSPEFVDCLAFCTKNPHPLISHLQYTIQKKTSCMSASSIPERLSLLCS